MTFKRRIRPGFFTKNATTYHLDIMIELTQNKDGKECLKLTGSYFRGGGQISYILSECKPHVYFSKNDLVLIQEIWDNWHLNDMRAGTKKQEDFLRPYKKVKNLSYDEACEILSKHDLLIDNGYGYGSAWLYEKVPEHLLEYLFTLTGSGDSWDDIRPPNVDIDALFDLLLK